MKQETKNIICQLIYLLWGIIGGICIATIFMQEIYDNMIDKQKCEYVVIQKQKLEELVKRIKGE